MKQRETNLKREYEATLAYYRQTVWQFVKGIALEAAQYDVAVLAYGRLFQAQKTWLSSLRSDELIAASKAEPAVEKLFHPRSFQEDETIAAEILAAIATSRLGTRLPRSLPKAIDEA